MNDITLPDNAADLVTCRSYAQSLASHLSAAYWMIGRDDGTAAFLVAQARDDFAKIAAAMGYTIARKGDPQAAIAALKARWDGVCSAMNRGSWTGSEADALAEIERIKGEIAMIEVGA